MSMYRTKSDILSCFDNNDIEHTERIKNNTYKVWLKDGTVIIRLHHTDIITMHPNGNVTLSSGGWETLTTKSRINEFIPFNNLYISQHDYIWYIEDVNNPRKIYKFYDGITFDINGNIVE